MFLYLVPNISNQSLLLCDDPHILFKFSLFLFYFRAGNICTYVSNQRMTTAIDTIEETAKDNLDDIDTYLELVQKVLILIF